MVLVDQSGNVCFAQSAPVLQAPKSNPRDARLFVTFRQTVREECRKKSQHLLELLGTDYDSLLKNSKTIDPMDIL